jgi:nitrite reductase/ring-hydroxylating ferredoxin subunit
MFTVAVGLLRDLDPKRVMRAQVGGQDLVIWRASNGDISAWDNRCPHRGMALSHGFVRGNDLACLYHGWHYGSTGVCRYIPAHPELEPPATIAATVFSVAASDGVIWVNTEGAATPAPVPIACQPLRSFDVEALSEDLAQACRTVAFKGVAPQQIAHGHYQLGARQVLLLENPLDAGRIQITALIDADAKPEDCAAMSRWCDAVRRTAQTKTVAA